MASLDNAYNGFDNRTTFYESINTKNKCVTCKNNLEFFRKEYDLEKSYKGFPMRSSPDIIHAHKLIYKCNICKKNIVYNSY